MESVDRETMAMPIGGPYGASCDGASARENDHDIY